MIDLDYLYDLIDATPYTVEYCIDREPNIQELTELPIVYVGYSDIGAKNPNAPIENDLYNSYGEDLVQGFDIHIVTKQPKKRKVVTSIVLELVASTTVIATCPNHESITGDIVSISGCTGVDASLYNGNFQITIVDANTFTYTVTNIPSANALGSLKLANHTQKLSTIWQAVYKAIIGKHPTIEICNLAAVSGFTYAQGGVIGLSNGKIWWQDRWKIGFPTVPALF